MAPREDAEVLQNDGFEQRRHEFVRGRADFLQAVDVGLGEDAALASNFVQFNPVVALHG